MSDVDGDSIDELRAAFDREFALAPAAAATAQVDLLRIRLGDTAYAVVLGEISGLFADVHVVPMPSPAPELLGVASLRTAIVPVYDLRAVLGAGAEHAPRWLVVGRELPALAFAFAGFDGHARLAGDAIAAAAGAFVRGTVTLGDRLHQVIELASIHASLHSRWSKKG